MRRFAATLVLLALAQASSALAVSKNECKEHALTLSEAASEFGFTEQASGRELHDAVRMWIARNDDSAVAAMQARIKGALDGVAACEAAALSRFVEEARGKAGQLKPALTWLAGAAAAEAGDCQGLLSQAVGKQGADVDGAIADLERYLVDCPDHAWRREAHQRLAFMLLKRGDAERQDHARAHEQARAALALSDEVEPEMRPAFRAFLARAMIEAGETLMQEGRFDIAREHWQTYIDAFGTPSFDVLFDVEAVARGAMSLRKMHDARYQLFLTCVETGDAACVVEKVMPGLADFASDASLIRDLTERAFARAAAAEPARQAAAWELALDLLDAWHELEPDAYFIDTLIDKTLVARERDERLELLARIEQCWVPMRVVEALRRKGESFMAEAELAVDCGDGGQEAGLLLADLRADEVQRKLAQLGTVAVSAAEREAVLSEIEAMLPALAGTPHETELRARLRAERANLRNASAGQLDVSVNYGACTDLLASIQWVIAREQSHDSKLADFKQSCCPVLRPDPAAWVRWMQGRPANVRLADAEIENKRRLMQEYCSR